MTLAQVQAAVAVVVALIGTWAGLLMAVALLLPDKADRAEAALDTHTKRCFLHGLGLMGLFAVGLMLASAPAPPLKLLGLLLMLGLSALLTLGATGMAKLMGRRIGEMSGARTSFGFLVRGSFVYSAALGFPLIGWYVFAPISLVCALGAGAAALRPARHMILAPPTPAPSAAGTIAP